MRTPDRRWADDGREAPTGKNAWIHSRQALGGRGPVRDQGALAAILVLAWAPCAGAATLDRDIATGNDDDGQFYGLAGPTIMFGGVQGYSANYGQGFRFTNITIPQGSTVTSTYLWIVNNKWPLIGIDIRLTAIDEDNTAAFSGCRPPDRGLSPRPHRSSATKCKQSRR